MDGRSLLHNLSRVVERDAARAALVERGSPLSYGELWSRIGAVAQRVQDEGVTPGARVAIALPISCAWVECFYGVLAAGGVAVPVNPLATSRELTSTLAHCAADLLITAPEEAQDDIAGAPKGQARLWQYEVVADTDRHRAPAMPGLDADAYGPACIVYTSGTTGAPKGVVLSHRGLATNTAGIVRALGLSGADSGLAVLPFHYVYGASVLHTHLAAGSRLVLEPTLVFPHRIVETLVRERVSGFSGVPATYALLLARVRLEDYDLGSLRYLTCAGAALAPAIADRLAATLPRARLHVMYGQSEASARLTMLQPDARASRPASVGRPIDGVALEIRREDGSRAQVLEHGEIWASGANLMLGYWRDPDATAATLQDGWLRTGDTGWLDAEGYLYLAGRRGDIIKTGAHRVSPEEVEEVLLELPQLQDAAVIAVPDDLLGEKLKAFVVAREGAELQGRAVQAHCRAHLPAYKVPAIVVFCSTLPRTESGKLRRQALRDLGDSE